MDAQRTAAEDATTDHSSVNTPTPARDAVLVTPELLDAILSVLPFTDILFRAQRVCKDWKHAVARSPTIQTKLWLKPQASKPISPDFLSSTHPLLTGTWTEETYYYRTELQSNLPLYNGKVAYNPLFCFKGLKNTRLTPFRPYSYGNYSFAGLPVKNSYNILHLQEANKAQHTWFDMYLTEPPVTSAQLDVTVPVRTDSDNSYRIAYEVLHDPRGLTFRTILDRVEEMFQSDLWRTTRRYRFCKPGLASVKVELFAGDENVRTF